VPPINISSSKCTLWYTDDILNGQVCLRMGCRGNYWWSERRSAKDWRRKVYNREIHLCYFYPSSSKVIKSWRRCWAWHVARVGRGENYVRFEGEKLIERNYFQELGMDGRLIRKRRLKKQDGRILSGFIWFHFLIGAGLCDHIHEPLRSVKCGRISWLAEKTRSLSEELIIWQHFWLFC
jgi:hypothetical protein